MKITTEQIQQLRQETSCGVMDCRKALMESQGDFKKAKEVLIKRGLELAAKKADREAKQGRIESYVHLGNKIGVLLEVNCETDFVARNEDFCRFTKDVAMQIAAAEPKYLKKEDVSKEDLKDVKDKEDFYKKNCLMDQVFIKDPSLTVKDYLASLVAKIGENIIVRRFTRYKLGE
ncbi:MAG: translation elongation factor Ts [Candidatus Omnitrophica bacterium]|nr:translation elongation factor Ts [Candidatus Omnitrophota bacterium]HOX54450.1 translation elongation factor Ts [Candidatus Omnitrophota bacterium]